MAEFDMELKEVMEDRPTIEGALRNLATVLTAKSVTRSDSDPGVSRSQVEWVNCMKLFYKAANSQTFKDSPQWGVDHPQGHTQTALDRVDQIKRYKVIKSLYDKLVASDAKPAKYFGKKFFTWSAGTFDEVKERAYTLANLSESEITKTEDKCALVEFCEVLEQSLLEGDVEYGDLIWALDFQKALQKRQADRIARVKVEQKEREEAAKAEMTAMLKNNVGTGGADEGDGDDGGRRVEELPDP